MQLIRLILSSCPLPQRRGSWSKARQPDSALPELRGAFQRQGVSSKVKRPAPTLTPEMPKNSEANGSARRQRSFRILKQQTDAQPADSSTAEAAKTDPSRAKKRACRSAPSTPTFLRASCDVALASGLRTPPPKPPRHISRQRSRQKLPQRPLPIPQLLSFGSTMCHMDHLAQAASRELLHQAGELASAADTGQLTLPLESRSRAARQILSRAFVQSLPIGGADFACAVPSARLPYRNSRVRELLKTPNSTLQLELNDSLRKLAQCLTVGDRSRRPVLSAFSAILHFLADLFALLAAKHLFAQPDSRAGKRKRWTPSCAECTLSMATPLLYLSNSNEQSNCAGAGAKLVGELGRHRKLCDQLSARKVAAVNEPDWLCSTLLPGAVPGPHPGPRQRLVLQAAGRQILQPVVELSLAGCDLDSGLLPHPGAHPAIQPAARPLPGWRRARRRVLSALCPAAAAARQPGGPGPVRLQSPSSVPVAAAGCLPSDSAAAADLDLSWNDLSEATRPPWPACLTPLLAKRNSPARCRLASDALRAICGQPCLAPRRNLPGAGPERQPHELPHPRPALRAIRTLELKAAAAAAEAAAGCPSWAWPGSTCSPPDLQKLLSSGGCDGCPQAGLGPTTTCEAGGGGSGGPPAAPAGEPAVNSCRLGGRGLRRLLEAAKISAPRLRLAWAPRRRRCEQEIAEAAEATGGQLPLPVDDEVQQVERDSAAGSSGEQPREASAAAAAAAFGGVLRRLAVAGLTDRPKNEFPALQLLSQACGWRLRSGSHLAAKLSAAFSCCW
uniref:Rho-GAP domain-containing protein n=1 Tax=Macrostomum lignano TaxID=282301 RepID=A0A1I8F9T5_9PLAT